MRGSGVHILMVVWLMIITAALASCDHISLDYPVAAGRVAIDVEFDWEDDPEASPDGMAICFFRLNTNTTKSRALPPAAFELKGREGGRISIEPGRYAVICHNSDSDRHGYVDYEVYEDFGLRLTDLRRDGGAFNFRRIPAREIGNERLATSPDEIWVGSLADVEVAPNSGSGADDIRKVRIKMNRVVHLYTFIIHNPINFTGSLQVSAAVSGMAGSVHPGRGLTGEEMVTHVFDMVPLEGGGLKGELMTFGHCGGRDLGVRSDGDAGELHSLVVSAVLGNGESFYSVHDVTEHIHSSKEEDVTVELDSIVFPTPFNGGSGGGLKPSVNGWTGKTEWVGM